MDDTKLPPGFVWTDQLPDGGEFAHLRVQEPLPGAPTTLTMEPSPTASTSLTDILQGVSRYTERGLTKVGLPKSAAGFIVENALPQTPTDLGIWIATMPFAEGRLALRAGETVGSTLIKKMLTGGTARVMATTAAGAAGGALGENGETMTSGAFKGGIAGLGGEMLNKIGRMASYFPWIKKIATEDAKSVGETVADMVPTFGKVKTLKQFQAMFMHGLGERRLGKMYQDGINQITDTVQSPTYTKILSGSTLPMKSSAKTPFNTAINTVIDKVRSLLPMKSSAEIPSMKSSAEIPFNTVIDKVRSLREDARNLFNRSPVEASQVSELANKIESEAIGSLPKEQADKYLDVKREYARGKTFLRFFEDENMLTNDGLNTEKLQKKFRAQGLSERDSVISAAEVGKFENTLFRGADTGSIITDEDLDLFGKFHIRGLSLPIGLLTEKKFVGKTARRGLEIPRALSPFIAGRGVSSIDRPISLRSEEEQP